MLFVGFRYEKKLKAKTRLVLSLAIIVFLILIFIISQVFSSKLSDEEIFTCSMYHAEKDFNAWWENNQYKYENNGITKEQFKDFPFRNGLVKLALSVRVKPQDIKVGDVITYYDQSINRFVSHRAVKKWQNNSLYFFQVVGDNDNLMETINSTSLRGKLVELRILSFFEHDGCIEKQKDYAFCKNKERDLCKDESLAHCCKNNESYLRGECFYLNSKDPEPSLCCSAGDWKWRCFEEFAIERNNIKFCNLIDEDDPTYRSCLLKLAVKNSDVNLCRKLQNITIGCVRPFINKDCTPINPITNHLKYGYLEVDYCFQTVAEATSNIAICDEVYNETARINCKANIPKQKTI